MTLEVLPRHRYRLDGADVPSVTTLIDRGFPKPALIDWAGNATADYVVDHFDELAGMRPSERSAILRRARYLDRDRAAVNGTRVHDLAHRLAAGERVDVPETYTGYVDSYLRFVAEWQPRELLVEAAVFNRAHWYAGRLDLIAQLADERTWLLDFKTGKGVYPEVALQAAGYRNAECYVDADGAEQPLPAVDAVGVVHLRADGYDLVPLDAGPEAWAAFLYVVEVADFAEQGRERWVDEPLTPPIVEALA